MARASLAEIARQAGLSDHTVKLCITKAGLTHGRAGWDVESALQACRDHSDILRAAGHDLDTDNIAGSTAREQLAAAKITTVELQNARLRMENEHRRGELVERAAVEATALDIIANAKAALLALKYKLAPLVAVETDVTKIQKLIGDEITAALGEIADIDAFTDAVLN